MTTGARDVQRAFRARRAAHLAKLEDRITELEIENNRLRVLCNLPVIGRDELGSGPTGRGKSLKEGGVPMAERVKAKKERDRLRAQQAARANGQLPPSNEEVDKAHGHKSDDDTSSRRTMTMTPESPGSLQLGRSPSFNMATPNSNLTGRLPNLGDLSAASVLGLHKLPFNQAATPTSGGQMQNDLAKLYQQAYLASQLSSNTANPTQNWAQPSSQPSNNGFSTGDTSNNNNNNGQTPNLQDLLSLITGFSNQTQRPPVGSTQPTNNTFASQAFPTSSQASLPNMTMPLQFPATSAPSFPSNQHNIPNLHNSYGGTTNFPDTQTSTSFSNFGFPSSAEAGPSQYGNFNVQSPSSFKAQPQQQQQPPQQSQQPSQLPRLTHQNMANHNLNKPRTPSGNSTRSPGDMGPPLGPSGRQNMDPRNSSQQSEQKKTDSGTGEPDLLHRLRHCCHLTDHHVATDPGLLLFASRLCLASGCPFSGNHRGEDGDGKRRHVESGHDDESENPEGYVKLETAWLALRSHLDPTPDSNPLLNIPGLTGGGERDGQNEIATGRLAAEMVLRGARSKMQASQGSMGAGDADATQLSYWLGCRRTSGFVIEKGLIDNITIAF